MGRERNLRDRDGETVIRGHSKAVNVAAKTVILSSLSDFLGSEADRPARSQRSPSWYSPKPQDFAMTRFLPEWWQFDWAKTVLQTQPRNIIANPRMNKKDGPCGLLIRTNTEDKFALVCCPKNSLAQPSPFSSFQRKRESRFFFVFC